MKAHNGFQCRWDKGILRYTPEAVRQLNHFYRDIYYRLHKRDQNYVMVVTGATGSGKSYASLRVAQQIDPNFDVTKQVIFSPDQFMDVVKDKKLHQGAVIIWEEVGVNYSSKEWYSVINKQIGYIFQTFRKKHICLIMTVPDKDFLDSTARKLLNAEIRMMGINRTENITYAKIYFSNYESNTKKWYYKNPRVTKKDTGIRYKATAIEFPKVDAITAHKYEKIRADYMEQLGQTIGSMLDSMNQKKMKKVDKSVMVKQVFEKHKNFRNKNNGKIDTFKIQNEYGCSKNQAYEVKAQVETLTGER